MWLRYYDLSCSTLFQYLLVTTLLGCCAAAPQFRMKSLRASGMVYSDKTYSLQVSSHDCGTV